MSATNSSPTPTVDECPDPLINETLLYQFTMIPASMVILIFCFTQKRRSLRRDILHGFPGLVHPMDIWTRADRLSYACAYGSSILLLWKCIAQKLRAVTYEGPLVTDTLILIFSVLVFGLVYYPVFACLISGSALRAVVGSLYVWMMTAITAVQLTDCGYTGGRRAFYVCQLLPQLVCQTYLSWSIPVRFAMDIKRGKRWRFFVPVKREKYTTMQDLVASADWTRVKNLLIKPDKEREVPVGTKARIKEFAFKYFYRPYPGW